MTAQSLTTDERQTHLPPLGETGWGAVPGRDAIRKVWKFRNFSEAWGFMTRCALAAEKANHHPEWTNRFNIVDVTLITHDCAGLSMLDITLARQMDRLSGTAACAIAACGVRKCSTKPYAGPRMASRL